MPPDASSITALIPCYNAAPFLEQAIRSAQGQTRAVAEVVVVDDASTDGSADLAEQLGARVLRLPRNVGKTAARNAGVAAARTELIALLDADDWWYPELCETLGGLLDAHPAAVAAFGALDVIDPRLHDYPIHTPGIPEGSPVDAFERCVGWWIGQPTACLVRRTAYEGVGGMDPHLWRADDFDLWLRLAEVGPFVASHDRLAAYRQHEGQVSAQRTEQLAELYTGRYRAWERAGKVGNEERRRRVAELSLGIWQQDLTEALRQRDLPRLRRFLAAAPEVPGSGPHVRPWRRRAILLHWSLAARRVLGWGATIPSGERAST
jgi:glycosyltransferase involved in cell wall biosynthesis